MASFGRKTGSLKKLKETLAKGGNGSFVKYVPKNGSLNVRFIQEPEDWVSYMEHYDQVLRASYPCNGESSCPGCVSGERKSSRYLANAVNLDDNDRVVPLQLPKDLANRLVIKYEKWGSLTDRDIELTRQGEGLDTTYDMDAGAQDRKSIAKYVSLDLLKVLEDVYNGVFGGEEEEEDKPVVRSGRAKSSAAPRGRKVEEEDEEDDDEEDEAPVAKSRARRAAAPAAAPVSRRRAAIKPEPEDDEEDDDEEDDEDEKPTRTAASRRAASKTKAPEPEPEDEDDEEDDEEVEEYDEDQLTAMTLGQVRAVARDLDIETKGKSKVALIEEIMDGAEDEAPF